MRILEHLKSWLFLTLIVCGVGFSDQVTAKVTIQDDPAVSAEKLLGEWEITFSNSKGEASSFYLSFARDQFGNVISRLISDYNLKRKYFETPQTVIYSRNGLTLNVIKATLEFQGDLLGGAPLEGTYHLSGKFRSVTRIFRSTRPFIEDMVASGDLISRAARDRKTAEANRKEAEAKAVRQANEPQSLITAGAYRCGMVRDVPYEESIRYWSTEEADERMESTPLYPSVAKLAFNFQVAPANQSSDFHELGHCNATVIDRQWLLTAAHCVDDPDDISKIFIKIANPDNAQPTDIKRLAADVICHGSFDYDTLENDIALIRLDTPLPASIAPTPLDEESQSILRSGSTATAAGWPTANRYDKSQNLNIVSLSVIESDRQNITARSLSGIVEGVCKGESGGPLFGSAGGTKYVAGILSGLQPDHEDASGRACAKIGYNMYFTPVASFAGWVYDVMGVCDRNPQDCRLGTTSGSDTPDTTSASLQSNATDRSDQTGRQLCLSKGGSVGTWSSPPTCDMPDGISYQMNNLGAYPVFQ